MNGDGMNGNGRGNGSPEGISLGPFWVKRSQLRRFNRLTAALGAGIICLQTLNEFVNGDSQTALALASFALGNSIQCVLVAAMLSLGIINLLEGIMGEHYNPFEGLGKIGGLPDWWGRRVMRNREAYSQRKVNEALADAEVEKNVAIAQVQSEMAVRVARAREEGVAEGIAIGRDESASK